MKLWKALLMALSVVVLSVVASLAAVVVNELWGVSAMVFLVTVLVLSLVIEFINESGETDDR